MTSVLSIGKYRSRKDWSTSSIPTLVSLEEETNQHNLHNNQIIEINGTKIQQQPLKPPRRSSIAISLFSGRSATLSQQQQQQQQPQIKNNERINKRRSSIAVAFLGRRDNKNRDNNIDVPLITESLTNLKKPEIPVINVSVPPSDNDDGFDNEKDKRRRRSSWAAKLERRRRKGLTSTSVDDDIKNDEEIVINNNGLGGNGYNRQKRHSWWNIFVPENLKQRSRRASQDVGVLSRSADNIAPYSRSKSRSVDHGLAPYEFDSLRSKVDGRLGKDNDKKKILIPTISYKVGDRDTLTSVAARFDTTPSELTALNRLASSFIYPGQNLLVPDKDAKDNDSASSDQASSSNSQQKLNSDEKDEKEEKELLDGLRPGSPKPGHIERIASPNTRNNDDDPVTTQRFLKINVRHITDGQGVVGGVLLVTPNAVMFDPNVSDPLVIEHGPESYGVIAPMELVVNAAIFHDIAHMRVGGGENNHSNEKPEVYYPKSYSRCENTHSPGKDSLLVKELHFQDETFPELGVGSVEGCDDQESVCSSNEREGDAFPKAFERELVTPTNLQRAHGDSTESGSGSTEKPLTDIDTKDKLNRIEGTTTNIISNDKTDAKLNKMDGLMDVRSLEERRKSLLDHHWAVPSKDKSLDDDEENQEAVATVPQQLPPPPPPPISIAAIDDESSQLVKLSCHDSGIDIRDPNSLPTVQPIPAKKVYSDADIVLSSEWVPPLTIAPTLITESSPKGGHTTQSVLCAQSAIQTQNIDSGGRKKTSSVSFSVENDDNVNVNVDKIGETKKNKMLKRLSYPLAWVEGLTGETSKSTDSDSTPNTGDSNQSVFSKVFSRRSSIGTFIRPHSSEGTHPLPKPKAPTPKLDYRSMVSIDDMPELFVSFDKLIPRPARACPDPPLYLRLRMGRPIGKAPPLPTSVMSYGKNKLRPEYWFSIPKNRVDELYRFLNTWVPQLYGELDDEQVIARGYELIQHDTEWAQGSTNKDGRSNSDGEITELTRESWEVLSMSTDDYRKASLFAPGSFDQDFPIPELIGQTEILTEEHREKLCSHLPARAEGYAWSLVFNTSQHGFSLNSLYRKMQRLESPVLIVIQDTENNVFGALTSCPLHVSDHFYGTGESLLYKFNPHFKVFHWSGENLYFIKGNPESLAIGAGDGKFGLWLDGDLNQGRSQRCSTYSNEPLAPQEDFVIKTLECWAFV